MPAPIVAVTGTDYHAGRAVLIQRAGRVAREYTVNTRQYRRIRRAVMAQPWFNGAYLPHGFAANRINCG